MKISDIIQKHAGASPAPTHIFDRHARKIYDVESHRHLLKVREDLAAGRAVYIPRRKS